MHGAFLRVLLLLAAFAAQAIPCDAYVAVPLSNGDMTVFASGIASDWMAFDTGATLPAAISFYPDVSSFRSAPYSQGISGIGVALPYGSQFGVGVLRTLPAIPGAVYLLVGYQDFYDPTYMAPPARRYAHLFGIGTYGETSPPQPFTMGGLMWMGAGQWFFNDMPGNSTQVGGMHRCTAAWPARNGLISIWTGLFTYADAPASTGPTVFTTDDLSLFRFDNPVQPQLQNAGFEIVEVLTPGLDPNDISRITLPSAWIPVGGGVGQKESFYTDSYGKRTGSTGLRIYNHRGCFTRGVMQRVAVASGAWQATFSVWVRSNKSGGTTARIGIDPAGGDDVRSTGIVWGSYTRADETWQQVTVSAPCSAGPITLFLCATNDAASTGAVHYADFDDASLTFEMDQSPPEPFSVLPDTPATLTTFLSGVVSPVPYDPESGISRVDYAIGSIPGGEDIRPFTPCSDAAVISAPNLALTPGQTCYITVRATNGAGLTTVSTSDPVVCSPRPYTYTWHAAGHLSQTCFSADNVRLAAASHGRVFAVWRESDDMTWSGSHSRIVFRERAGLTWSSPVQVNTEDSAWWPDVAASPQDVAVSYVTPGDGLANDLRVAVKEGSGSFDDRVALSQVSAFPRLAWSPRAGYVAGCGLNASGVPSQGIPSLALNGPDWSVESLPGGMRSGVGMKVSVSPSDQSMHCLWECLDGGGSALYYCRRDAQGVYSPPKLIAVGASQGCIASLSDDEAAVAFRLNGGIWYADLDSQGPHRPLYLGPGSYPSVAVEPSDRVHVLFYQDTGQVNRYGVPLLAPVHLFRDSNGWSIPKAVCPASCTSGAEAQEPGHLVVDSFGGLHFAWSNNPEDPGWQHGIFRGYYWIDYHTTTTVTSETGDIAAAKLWGDDMAALLGYAPGKTVSLQAKQVTAVGSFRFLVDAAGQKVWKSVPCFYIQEDDRSSGIRVIAGDALGSPMPELPVQPGDLVNVSGALSTIDGERTIGCLSTDGAARYVSYTVVGSTTVPARPIGMSIRCLGGAALGPTPGPSGGIGANNVGLLVRVAGTVTRVSNDERGVKILFIDDGSNVECGESTGCKVYAYGSTASVGDFVAITGVSSVETFDPTPGIPGDETLVRVLIPREDFGIDISDRR